MKIVLGENRYGKAENRVVRVTRTGDTHELLDINVTSQLTGDQESTHYTGANDKVLPTDTQKNTIYAFAQKYPAMPIEKFGLTLCEHFLKTQPHFTRAEVRIEQFFWERIKVKGTPHPRAFRRDGSMKRVARIVLDQSGAHISSGLEDLVVLKTSDSEFTGYIRDHYTTLPETSDRIMATQVSAKWQHMETDATKLHEFDFDASFTQTCDALLEVFGEHYSLSLQQTLFEMGKRVITEQPSIAAVRLSLPNKHHFLVDLSPFGQENKGEVFHADDRPYGLIEAVVTRDDATDPGFVWPSW